MRRRGDSRRPPNQLPPLALALAAGLVLAPALSAFARHEALAQALPQVPGISVHGADDFPASPPSAPSPQPAAPEEPAAKPPAKLQEAKTDAGEPSAPKKQSPKPAAKPKPDKTAAVPDAPRPKGSGQSIAILVNDEPITGYEIEQRAAFLALSTQAGGEDMKAKAEARWQAIVKNPKTNERFQQLLKEKGVRTQEEARKLQAQYVKDLQRDMVEGLRREMRQGAVAGSKSKAQDELIDEKLKLQEAKRLSVVASDSDVDGIISGIAERNKMSAAQFAQYMKGMGVDIATMRARFLAEVSWREVIRRRFGSQVAIADRDVDKLVAANPGGDEDVELQLQRISIFTPPNSDQKTLAQKLAEGQTIASRFTDCKSTRDLAAQVPGARLDDLGSQRPSAIPEPTRSMLISARDGDVLPPVVGTGVVELWIVCGRKVITASEQKRETATAELKQKEFEILARKHLKDLRQDAAIEYR